MGFWSNVAQKTAAIGKFVPGADITKSFVDSYYLRKAAKAQDNLTEKNWALQQTVLDKIRQARKEGDSERVKRLTTALQASTKTDLVTKQLEQAVTNKEVIGDGVELALLATLGFKPSTLGSVNGLGVAGRGLPFTQAGAQARATIKALDSMYKATKALNYAERARKLGVAGKAINAAIPIIREAAFGSAFWGASSYAEGESPATIAKDASKGGAISAAIMAGTGAAGAILGKTIKTVGPKMSAGWRQAIVKLEEIANPAAKETDNVVDEILADIPKRKTIKQRFAEGTLKTMNEINKFEQRFIDRFSPLKRMEQRLADIKGAPLTDEETFLSNFRTAQPKALGIAEDEVKNMFSSSGVMGAYQDMEDVVKANIKNLDEIDRAKVFMQQINDDVKAGKISSQKGQQLMDELPSRVASGKTLEQLEETQKRLLDTLDTPTKARLQASLDDWNNYHKTLLQHRVNAGLINQETMDYLLKTHPNYMPHNVVREIDDAVARDFAITDTLNVGKTDIIKAKGSDKMITDPYLAATERTVNAWQIIENNKALRGLVEAQEKFKYVSEADMFKVKPGASAPEGKLTIDLFRDGVKETWVVPDDVAMAVKGVYDTPKPAVGGWKVFTYANNLMKKSATTLNLSFALPNKFRDVQTAAITADAFIDALVKKTGAMIPDSPITLAKKELLTLWKRSGGSGASIFREGKPTEKILDSLQKTGIWKNLKNANPLKVIDDINASLEESTRLEIFQKGLNKGLSAQQAAFAAREATIDFGKMGSWTRELNQYIPFLNARVQGFVNLPRAFIQNPSNFARTMLWTSVYPTLGLYQHNRQFESYSNISQYFKDKYWIVMTGEVDGKDTDGNPIKIPQFLTLPKGEGQSLVSNPISYFMERADGLDYRTVDEMLVDTLGSASPLSFQGWSGTNVFMSLVSQFGPAVSIPVGLGFNKDPFTGQPIVPESREKAETSLQFKYTTPETTKDIANFLHIAPAKLEFAIDSLGGLAQDIQSSVDIITKKIKGDKVNLSPLEDSPFGQATRTPILRRIFREVTESFSPEQEMLKERKAEIEKQLVSKKLKDKDQANKILNDIKELKGPEARREYFKGLSKKEFTPQIKQEMQNIIKNRQSIDQIRKTDSIELRAKMIVKRLNDFDNVQDKKMFITELRKAEILSDKTLKRVKQLMGGGYE